MTEEKETQGLPSSFITPTLYGEDAKEFLRRVEENKNKPLYLKPTPNIERARQLAISKMKENGEW